ncbi:FAD-binding oxidoreductase [Maribellus maritimus]|uniref:FAD-binding oxidoreductase n=1 Tax=Maribellus maritimus TaxID=2870838 RepID=UPI001EEAE76A|nr:FAD-binding oxidoreductase [Maribellus maritimus]MCG6188084.1 FAD-binding oxidoreductase [Maribellus maritimus]
MTNKNTFQPKWRNTAPKANSFRSIFKYGDPEGFKHPNKRLVEELKNTFGLSDIDFTKKESTGDEIVDFKIPLQLSAEQVGIFQNISGKANVSADEYERLKYSTGQTLVEHMKLRRKIVEKICDLVVHPRDKSEVEKIIKYCNNEKIPIIVYGGGSSVNFGLYPAIGGVTLVLSTHMNKIIELNETNQTVRVEAGILGPQLENALNNSKEKFQTKNNFTCGHFPQSFEYSSVGGWIVTLGSGQQSSYYGDAADLVLAIEMVTPAGTIKTLDFPATATGPKILDLIKGSEGIFGVVVEVTWKILRYMPENRKYFGFIFKNWKSAVEASREISQGEFGMPAVFRISDAEETHHGLKLYGIEGTVFDKLMSFRGFKAKERCLFIATSDGSRSFTKNVKRQVKKIARKSGGMYLTSFPAKKWEPGRYKDPYLKEDLMDYGILIDTLETSVKWDNLFDVHQKVRQFIKARPKTICLSHASHFYPQGTNLYFIFILKENDLKAYNDFQKGIIKTIVKSGGTLSHHHGVGKMTGFLMEKHLGKNQMNVLRALKKHFDPNNIMNPGGQLGL